MLLFLRSQLGILFRSVVYPSYSHSCNFMVVIVDGKRVNVQRHDPSHTDHNLPVLFLQHGDAESQLHQSYGYLFGHLFHICFLISD